MIAQPGRTHAAAFDHRIKATSAASARVGPLFKHQSLNRRTRVMLSRSLVGSVTAYDLEILGDPTDAVGRRLEASQMLTLRRARGAPRYQSQPGQLIDEALRELTGVPSVSSRISVARLRLAGRLLRAVPTIAGIVSRPGLAMGDCVATRSPRFGEVPAIGGAPAFGRRRCSMDQPYAGSRLEAHCFLVTPVSRWKPLPPTTRILLLHPDAATYIEYHKLTPCLLCSASDTPVFVSTAGLHSHTSISHGLHAMLEMLVSLVCTNDAQPKLVSAKCTVCDKVIGTRQKAIHHLAQNAPRCRRAVESGGAQPLPADVLEAQHILHQASLKKRRAASAF